MKIKTVFWSIFAFVLFSFTSIKINEEIKKDPNCSVIQNSVGLIKSKLKSDFGKMDHETFTGFSVKFRTGYSTLSTEEKRHFLESYFIDIKDIEKEFSKILLSIKKLSETNSEFKKLSEEDRVKLFSELLQSNLLPTCDMGLVGGTSGCANWAYALVQQGYPQSYANQQFEFCYIQVYIQFLLCQETGHWPES